MGQRKPQGTLPGELDDMREGTYSREGMNWLQLARDSYQLATNYLDGGVRDEWEDSLNRFNSEHAKGSKYYSKAYKKRSKIFRPKTRSNERRAAALVAKALFTNSDLVDVKGQNKGSEVQAASALVNKALIQYRLEHSIPWFITALGARQQCFNMGYCASLQTWKYELQETIEISPVFDETGAPVLDEDGLELGEEIRHQKITIDKPTLDLIPVENLRLDPNCDWADPVGSSPVITVMLTMYAQEIQQKMVQPNAVTGAPEWIEYSLSQILGASVEADTNETVRQARQGDDRVDPMTNNNYNEWTQCWVHLVIAKVEGVDYAYYTLSNHLMLTEPVPVEEVLPLGRKSLVIGFSIVEANKVYPIGGNKLGAPHQREINDIANQRNDNVKLALNKRYILRRGANIDQTALMRSVPGGGVTAGDPEKDVRVMEYNDVTASSYEEQDRLAQEMDELVGAFSGSSVQANRSLNETVGGMNLLSGDALTVSEMELKTWIETWVEPVLRNLQKLESMFETDETILQLAGENAEVFQRYGQDVVIDELLDQELTVSVSVGMGATDPVQKVQKFSMVLGSAIQIPQVAERIKGEEVGKEVFSMGGYSDGARFMMNEEEFAAHQEEMAQMAAAAQAPPPQTGKSPEEMQHEMDIEQLRSDDRRYQSDKQFEARMGEVAADKGLKLKELYEKIGLERDKIQTTRDTTALKEGNRSREMNIKQVTGSGI